MRKRRSRRNVGIAVLSIVITVAVLIGLYIFASNSDKNNILKNSTSPAATPEAARTVEESPSATPITTEKPAETKEPENSLVIRTDYSNYKPNESGDIPIVMFHRFIEAYEPNTEKDYTTTFSEFESLLQTLYDQGFRLISMKDFIDCNISVPAGTMPMVFTFDDGTPGQFSLIEENGAFNVNPKSAVGIMMKFNEKHPDFGLKGIFYVNMDIGDNTFNGEGTLKDRFQYMEDLGLEIGTHTWGHVDYRTITTKGKIEESLGKNQKKAEEILPGLRFYSLALPYGSKPKDKTLIQSLRDGSYDSMEYHHESIMAVGANPTMPTIAKNYNSLYVSRIRSQGRVTVDADLTWWLPKMIGSRMFVSDGDPKTIVVPKEKSDVINESTLRDMKLIMY